MDLDDFCDVDDISGGWSTSERRRSAGTAGEEHQSRARSVGEAIRGPGAGAQQSNARSSMSYSSVVARARGRGNRGAHSRGRGRPPSGSPVNKEGERVTRVGGRGQMDRRYVRARGGPMRAGGRSGESREGAIQCCAPPITAIVIIKISTMEPHIVAKRVHYQLRDFLRTIEDAKLYVGKLDVMAAIIKILLKLTTLANEIEGEDQRLASIIIAEILSERSQKFNMQLKIVVKGSKCTVSQANIFCSLFNLMLLRFESLAWEYLPIDELLETVRILTKAGTNDPGLLKRAEDLCQFRDQIRDKKANAAAADGGERDDSEFKLIPILPEWKEIQEDSGTPPEVRPNKVDAPYKDWMEYYDIQFRLIREDFIAPLRRGVAAFLQGDKGKKNRDVKTYSRAKIVSQVTTKEKGICFTIQFDVSGFCRVNYNWDQSKRLIFGSLLCFIPTHKNSESKILFSTVAETNPLKLSEGKLMVQFKEDILEAMTYCRNNTEFEIVESNVYLQAVSPILQSIQSANTETMPFTKQIIKGDCSLVLPPVYLRVNEDDSPVYDLTCLYGSKRRPRKLMVNVLRDESWEVARDSELDSSQLNAIQTALTQEIAVIQGPPGTGKTYIGLKIVEGLLENRKIWDPHKSSPILVMCYTNHALDQFLEGIIDTECCGRKLDVIRVGGRCKNEKVDAFNLKRTRKRHRGSKYSADIAALFRELVLCNPERALEKLDSHYHRTKLLPLGHIRTIADPDHYYQLTQVVKCKEQVGNEVEVWLGLWTDKSPGGSKAGWEYTDTLTIPGQRQNSKVPAHKLQEVIDVESEAIRAQDERMDENDAEGYKRAKLPEHDVKHPFITHFNEEFSDDESDLDEDSQRKPQRYRKHDASKIISKNLFKNCMDDEEAKEVEDITELSIKDQWRLYNYWEEQRVMYLQSENRKLVRDYTEKCKMLESLRQLEDGDTLEAADVVGMTTTGAAKYQHVLHHIKPKIVIVEEAAEVLEAHIVSALSAGTQHLILIGDHKQLRPKPNEHVLATKYNLSISLFERLVMKQMSQATLEIQHRMRPEIARLVCPHVYEKLLNHESVEKYPDIRGISKNLFFIRHTEPESENPNLLSYQNEFEAKYIAGLCAHLLRLGYFPSQITILTPYVGQLLMLKNKMPQSEFEGVRVTAIDNFQGEENDIILFSMVRSTNPNSSRTTIGFVKEDNRVCVSLSRAKHGFYAIGNFELIRHQSQLWESIISDVETRGSYGDALPLYCCNHPETKYSAVKDSDFITNAPNGGCRKMCDIRLPCGHACTRICHAIDTKHAKFKCMKACRKTCPSKHICKSLCHMECPPCNEIVEKIMPRCCHIQKVKCSVDPNDKACRQMVVKIRPNCGHEQVMACSDDPAVFFCQAPCSKSCKEGHPCQKKCHEDCDKCLVEVEKVIPGCLHKQVVPCHVPPNEFECRAPCPKCHAGCLHPCKRMCCEPCGDCKVLVQKTLPGCGHPQTAMCYKDPDPAKCIEECKKMCPNKIHVLSKRCNEGWPHCMEQVTKIVPKCGHKISTKCHQDPSTNTFICRAPCPKCHAGCLHPCKRMCCEPCRDCKVLVQKTLPGCGHPQTAMCYKDPDPAKCIEECKKMCPNKIHVHVLSKRCNEGWPRCMEQVTKIVPKCGHEISTKCHQDPTKIPCYHPCTRSCEYKGHRCPKPCYEKCAPCLTEVTTSLQCGHTHSMACFKASTNTFICPTQCLKLTCKKRHLCSKRCHCPESCGPCSTIVSVTLPCSHEQKVKCFMSIDIKKYKIKCEQPCQNILKCGHKCHKKCWERCKIVCLEKVFAALRCGHHKLIDCCKNTHEVIATIKCDKVIDLKLACGHGVKAECWKRSDKVSLKKLCKEKCIKTLKCDHPCKETCSKPCTKYCKKRVNIMLPCGHKIEIKCFESHGMDDYCCKEKCLMTLPCGHQCRNQCGQPCSTCNQKSARRYPCGHTSKIPCNSGIEAYPCKKMCCVLLSCGHRCSGRCGDCYIFQMHPICMFEVKLHRYCDHSAIVPCAGLSDSCDHKTHSVPCTHTEDHSNCHKPCSWKCKHFQSQKECREECDRPPCNKPCDKELSCGHRCPGLCGEWCLNVCPHCDPVNFTKRFHPRPKQGKLPKDELFFELNCGHIFTVKHLDEYMESNAQIVRPKQCPKCHRNIDVGNRYGNDARRAMDAVEDIKERTRELQSVSAPERVELRRTCRSLENYNDLHFNSSGLKEIQDKLRNGYPVSAEERCFVQCAESYCTVHDNLIMHSRIHQNLVLSTGRMTLKNLIESAEKCVVPKHEFDRRQSETPSTIHLSWQLLEDFMSQLYHRALSAQCSIAKCQLSLYGESSECAVVAVEQFIASLHPVKDRISEAQYEEHYSQLSSAVPEVANIHVQTPHIPTVVKGTWIKCSAGHYYCVPPVCGARAKTTNTTDSCPHCHT